MARPMEALRAWRIHSANQSVQSMVMKLDEMMDYSMEMWRVHLKEMSWAYLLVKMMELKRDLTREMH